MYIRNGEIINIFETQIIDDVQYPAPYLVDENNHPSLGIERVYNTTPPETLPSQKAVVTGFKRNSEGQWEPLWTIYPRTPEDDEEDQVALANAKIQKNIQINNWRLQANMTFFPHLGKTVACDTLSRSDIDGVANSIALTGDFPEGFPGGWKAIDNTFIPMLTTNDFILMHKSMAKQGAINFNYSQTLKAALAQATTLEQVAAIIW